MLRYVLKRFLLMIPVIIGISIFIFCIMQLAPGDPVKMLLGERATAESVEQLRHEMGLDQPKAVQYFHYMEVSLQRPILEFPIRLKGR